MKLTLSDKGDLVTSDFALTKKLVRFLKKEGIMYNAVTVSRDVGVAYTAGVSSRDSIKIVNRRFKETSHRQLRIIEIAKITKKARRLYSGSTHAASTWGHQSVCLPESTLIALERRASKATGIDTAGRCRFWCLVVTYGDRGHPIARLLKEIFGAWFQALADIAGPENFSSLRLAWSKIRQKLVSEKMHLHKKHGLMHNVVGWLYKLGGLRTT